jgi:hypothetical protein
MSREKVLEDVTRILNEQHQYMKIFESLENYKVTDETLPTIENLINLLEMHEEMLRTIRKNLTLKCHSYNIQRLMTNLGSDERPRRRSK